MVVLDGSGQSTIRLKIAVALAKKHEAFLIGFCALNMLRPGGHPGVEISVADEAERVEAEFREELRFAHLQGDWREATRDVNNALVRQARYTDVVILGQVDPDHPPPAGRHLVEDLLLTAGRPILVIPHAGLFRTLGTNVLIGWNGSREAARALNDAIPLIDQGASVVILEALPVGSKSGPNDTSTADVSRHLARHGIDAKTNHTVMTGISASDVLLSYAADVGADLLVVGGYGHSRLRELTLGGVTRGLLQHMTLPVLMSR